MCKVRQIGFRWSDIREDHRRRYEFAADFALRHHLSCALDVGCGVGYGSRHLAEHAHLIVHGIDRDEGAINHAFKHFNHSNVMFHCADLKMIKPLEIDLIVAFEILEHDPLSFEFLRKNRLYSRFLIGSVPNEAVVPFVPGKVNAEHYRHFTVRELINELDDAGWNAAQIFGQAGKRGKDADVNFVENPRTIVFVAEPK